MKMINILQTSIKTEWLNGALRFAAGLENNGKLE